MDAYLQAEDCAILYGHIIRERAANRDLFIVENNYIHGEFIFYNILTSFINNNLVRVHLQRIVINNTANMGRRYFDRFLREIGVPN